MIKVAPLRYGVIFKKAFCVPEIFNAFVRDVTGIPIEVDEVETEKSYSPVIGAVDVKFDLHAEDLKNRIIVDIQHERHRDHYDRFLYYTCVAIIQQIAKAKNYRPKLTVYTVVILTSGDKHKKDIVITDFDPKDRDGNGLGEISHKIIHIAPKYVDEKTPEVMREWFQAINDSLDAEVDEQAYERPEIHKIFELIQEDQVTSAERAKMFEEYNQEEKITENFDKGVNKGREEGFEIGMLQTQRHVLIRQLERKFADVPAAVYRQIEEAQNSEQLDAWLDTLWEADTLDELDWVTISI